jgi:hypothetical protein
MTKGYSPKARGAKLGNPMQPYGPPSLRSDPERYVRRLAGAQPRTANRRFRRAMQKRQLTSDVR